MDKREAITGSNLGPVVSVLTWIVEASVVIAVGIKFTLSSVIHDKRNREDVALFLATAFSIGFTISISLAVPNGVGRHQKTLSVQQLESLQMAVYSANILLVLSIAVFFLAPFFVAIFPCHPPHVWRVMGAECIDQFSFWEAFAGVDIVIEGALVLFPVFVVYPLRMSRGRKAIVVSCFAARLIVIGTFAAQIYQARSLKLQFDDLTFHSWKYLLVIEFVQGLSIITVCIPYIRTLLLGMESGMIQTGHFTLPSTQSGEVELPSRRILIGETNSNLSSNNGAKIKEPATSHGRQSGHI
ncbi:hypothetical protein F4824DRAFT_510456 [Ustulina deusta]|nr:hypothetical protein F4824DRAFT_510456 [Ustulina deusta]